MILRGNPTDQGLLYIPGDAHVMFPLYRDNIGIEIYLAQKLSIEFSASAGLLAFPDKTCAILVVLDLRPYVCTG